VGFFDKVLNKISRTFSGNNSTGNRSSDRSSMWIHYGAVGLLILFVVFILFQMFQIQGISKRSYFTGTLIFEDFNSCGLVKTRNQDWLGCKIAPENCALLREHANRRIQISGHPDVCKIGVALECSSKGEFNERGFKASLCFSQLRFVKVFPK